MHQDPELASFFLFLIPPILHPTESRIPGIMVSALLPGTGVTSLALARLNSFRVKDITL
jgi:hypothetical protein